MRITDERAAELAVWLVQTWTCEADIPVLRSGLRDLLADRREMQVEIERLRAERDAELRWRIEARAEGIARGLEVERLREQLKTPHPARDFVNECNGLLAAKSQEIERLRVDLARLVEAAGPFAGFDGASADDRRRLAAVMEELKAREGR